MGDNKEGFLPLRNFAFMLGIAVLVILSAVAYTPLSDLWFQDVSGLTLELAKFAKTPLQILAVIPALTLLLSFQRAFLVHSRNTQPITMATAIEVVGIIIVLLVLINMFDFIGVVAAAVAFLTGRIGAVSYLYFTIPGIK